MSRFFVGLALWALLLAFSACGGDAKSTDPARDAEHVEMVDTVVSTFEDLTVCTDKREGETVYVEDEEKAYVCESKHWTVKDSLSESIQDKDSDSAEVAEPGEITDMVVSTFDDLPACTKDRKGLTVYVEDEDSAYVCKKSFWVVDDSLTNLIQPNLEKKSSSSKAKASSSSVKSSSSSVAKSSSSVISESSSSTNTKSSSSEIGKSSSSVKSSSSLTSSSSVKSSSGSNSLIFSEGSVEPCKMDGTDLCEYGTLIDHRDGQVYKTVKIGEQWWMAEHLNYFTANSFSQSPQFSDKYGRFYTWAAAMDSAGLWSPNGKGCGSNVECSPTYPVRGVCPEGWHLPDTTEWNALFNAVGPFTSAKKLKSPTDWANINGFTDWGYDSYGFTGLPAGWYRKGHFYNRGEFVVLWSSTMSGKDYAHGIYLEHSVLAAELESALKTTGFSVRCLKDTATVSQIGYTPPDTSTAVKYSTLTDDRDGKTYKTVKIGEQWWMAENLNYLYSLSMAVSDFSNYCRDNLLENCDDYGRLYRWAVAMDSAGLWSSNGKGCGFEVTCSPTYPVRGICPRGWHLPSYVEFEKLISAVGGSATAGKMLKSTDWKKGTGLDAYGFSAIPMDEAEIGGIGEYTYFWSSTEDTKYTSYSMYMYTPADSVMLPSVTSAGPLYVRCVKDFDNLTE